MQGMALSTGHGRTSREPWRTCGVQVIGLAGCLMWTLTRLTRTHCTGHAEDFRYRSTLVRTTSVARQTSFTGTGSEEAKSV